MTAVITGGGLTRLGLRHDEPARFRPAGRRRWRSARITGVDTDGSVRLIDADGATRSLPADVVEVRRAGRQGGLKWTLVAVVATTWQQLELF